MIIPSEESDREDVCQHYAKGASTEAGSWCIRMVTLVTANDVPFLAFPPPKLECILAPHTKSVSLFSTLPS